MRTQNLRYDGCQDFQLNSAIIVSKSVSADHVSALLYKEEAARTLYTRSLTKRLPSLKGKERCRLSSVCAWFIVGCTTMNSNEGKPITGPCAPGIRFPFSPFFFSFSRHICVINIDLWSYFYAFVLLIHSRDPLKRVLCTWN